MSVIAQRIGNRHDRISDYFKTHTFGRNPEDLTVLSLLPPVDRCLILERVMEAGMVGDFLACIDKLSMAYFKAGWNDVARAFLEGCDNSGLLQGHRQWFEDKLDGLAVGNVSRNYSDALAKLNQYWSGSEFCHHIKELCLRYLGNDILRGSETAIDLEEFKSERRVALTSLIGRKEAGYVPAEHSEDVLAYILASSQAIAFSYLTGGARIVNFDFATDLNYDKLGSRIRNEWETTEPLVRRHSPYPFSSRRDAGERAYMVSLELASFAGQTFRYRTTGQRISLDDVVDLMYEVMDVKPRAFGSPHLSGEYFYRFSWMFLKNDVDRLLSTFPSVARQYGAWVQMRAVFSDMDRILNRIAQTSLDAYPFMETEFSGW